MKNFCKKSTLFSLVLFLLIQILLPINTKKVEASGGFMPQAFAKLTIKKVVSDLYDITDPLISGEKFTFEVVPTKIGYQDVTVDDYGQAYYTETQNGYTSEIPFSLSLGQLSDSNYDQNQISIDLPISSLVYNSSDNAYSAAIDTEVALWLYSGTTIGGYDIEGSDAEYVNEYFFQTRQAAENADIHPGRGTELIDGEYYVPISFKLKEIDNGSSFFEYDSTPQSFTYYVKLQKEIKGQSQNYSTGEEFGPFMVRFFAVDDGLFGSSDGSFQTIPESLNATFTNTFIPPKDVYYTFVGASLDIPENVTEVTVNKVWEGDSPENRPERITIVLYQDESQYDTAELTTTENISHTFTNLPKYNYELPDNFSFTFNIKNKESGEFISSHTATLKENGELEVSPIPSLIELSESGEYFEYSVEPIETDDYKITGDLFDNVGKGYLEFLFNFDFKNEHEYTVDEITPNGYNKYINGFTITNSLTKLYKDISVEKIWDHGDNPVDQRPQSVTIHLKANGQIVNSYTHEGSDDFTYTFKDLPIYDNNNIQINYTVDEDELENYTKTIDNYTISNTFNPQPEYVKDIHLTKVWLHRSNPEDSRPESVTINLLADGEIIRSYTHEGSDNFEYTFKNVPVYSGDKRIEYSIEEVPIEDYHMEIKQHSYLGTSDNLTSCWDKCEVHIFNTYSRTTPYNGHIDAYKKILLDNTSTINYAKSNGDYTFIFKVELYEGDENSVIFTSEQTQKMGPVGELIATDLVSFTITNPGQYTFKIYEINNGINNVNYDETIWYKTFNIEEAGEFPELYLKSTSGILRSSTGKTYNDRPGVSIQPTFYNRFVIPQYTSFSFDKMQFDKTTMWHDSKDGTVEEGFGINWFYADRMAGAKFVLRDSSGNIVWQSTPEQEATGKYIIENIRCDKRMYVLEEINIDQTHTVGKDFDDKLYFLAEGWNPGPYEPLELPSSYPYYVSALHAYNKNYSAINKIGIYINKVEETSLSPYMFDINDDITIFFVDVVEIDGDFYTPMYTNDQENINYMSFQEIENTPGLDHLGNSVFNGFRWWGTSNTDYSSFIIGNGYTPTNFRDITITKTWIHNNNPVESRPKSVTINLLANGEIINSYTHEGSDDFSYTFENLTIYDENDEQIDYTISENEVENYKSTIDGFNVTNEYENLWTLNIEKFGEKNTTLNRLGTIYELEGAVFHIFDAETDEELPIETIGNVHTVKGLKRNRAYYITEEPMEGFLTDKPRLISLSSDFYIYGHFNTYKHEGFGNHYNTPIKKIGIYTSYNNYYPSFGSLVVFDMSNLTKDDISNINRNQFSLTYEAAYQIKNDETTIYISNPEEEFSDDCYKPYKSLKIIKNWEGDSNDIRPDSITINAENPDGNLALDDADWIKEGDQWTKQIEIPFGTIESNNLTLMPSDYYRWGPLTFEWHLIGDTFNFDEYTFSEENLDGYSTTLSYYEDEEVINEFTINEFTNDYTTRIFAASDKNLYFLRNAENLTIFDKNLEIYNDSDPKLSDPRNPASPAYRFYTAEKNPYYRLYINDEVFSDLKTVFDCDSDIVLVFTDAATLLDFDLNKNKRINLWGTPNGTVIYSFDIDNGLTPVQPGDKIKLVKVHPTLEITNTRIPEYPVSLQKRALNGLSNKIGSTMSLFNEDKVLLEQWVSKEEPQEFNLKPGKYSLTEDISPDGLLRVTNTMEFEVSNDGIVNIITNANTEEGKLSVENNLLTLEDIPEKINISVTKIWLDNNNEFGLRPSKEDWLNSLHVYANDKELNLEDYDVNIIESKSESGDSYIVTVKSVDAHDTEKLVEFTVSEDDIAGYESTVSLENGIIVINKSTAKKQEKDLLIKKVDQNGDPVQGVTFEIYQNLNDELQLIHKGTTNEQGELNVTNILASYSITGKIEDNLINPILTVIEIEVPDDYILDETPHTINILEENSITIENWKIPPKNYDITKADLSTTVSIDGNSASNEKELYVVVDNDAQNFTISDRIIYSGLREDTDYIVESSIAKIIGNEENIIVSISTERSTTEADGYWDITFNDVELTYDENVKYVVYEKVINKEDISEFISHKDPSDIAQTIILEKKENPPVTPPVEPDEPKKVEINITKHILDGEPLLGVKLSVEGEDFFDEWITDENPHVLSIIPGEYTLRELESVDGYKLITTSIVFKVTEDEALELITKDVDGDGRVSLSDSNGILLENAPLPPEPPTPPQPPTPPIIEEPDIPPVIEKYTVEFQKVDAENNTPLVGAQLQVKDKDGKVLYSWTSTITSHKFVLEPGSYTLSESSAPEGYKLAEPIHFEVKDTNLINDKKIVLKNEKKPTVVTPVTPVTPSPTIPQQPTQVNNTVKTGYDSNILLYMFILSTCLSLVVYLQKKRARN